MTNLDTGWTIKLKALHVSYQKLSPV